VSQTATRSKIFAAQKGEEFQSEAAPILLQTPPFSLNNSQTFNRLQHAQRQQRQHNSNSRWNTRKKIDTISLDLPRCHTAVLFVLCASVLIKETQLSALKL
jgi:hypothetical protein